MGTSTHIEDKQNALEGYLRGCAQGQHHELKKLYKFIAPNLFSVALRILNNRADAEDCLQQVFIKIWNHAGDYDDRKAKAQTWLNTITRNQALDILRRNQHKTRHDSTDALEQLDDGSPNHEQQLNDWQDRKQLHQCLTEIPEQQRRCLELAYFEGLTHQALSDITDTSLGTIKTWIRRGLIRLKACMNSI